VRLQEELGLTFVMVTHDQEEAMSMASRLAVMDLGRIRQVGTPHEVYERPCSRFVADFIGIANILPLGDRWLALRPEKIALSVAPPETPHHIAGEIVDIAYEGDRSLYRVATETGVLLVSSTNVVRNGEGFRRTQRVWLSWSGDAGQVLDE
jgi:ABC-type Fe3+/spermidine/putrescine transport system ATPase subunit